VVTTPEEMPIEETIDLVGRARRELTVPLGAVFVNRVLPELFTHADAATFAELSEPARLEQLEAAVGPGVGAVMGAAELAVAMRRSRVEGLTRLRSTVELPTYFLPYVFARSQGRRETAMVADALAAELGL